MFDVAQLGDCGGVEHARKAPVLLGDPQAHIGATGYHLRLRVRGAQCQKLQQAARLRVGAVCGLLRDGLQQGPCCGLVLLGCRVVAQAAGRVDDGAVTGAAAQVAAEVFFRHSAVHGMALAHPVLVQAEQAHRKTGGAKTALGRVL